MALEHLALSRSTLDRASHLRSDPQAIEKLWADPATAVIPVLAGQAPIRETPATPGTPASATLLASAPGTAWLDAWGPDWQPDLTRAAFLGLDEHGQAHLAIPLDAVPDPTGLTSDTADPNQTWPLPDGVRWAGLREVGLTLDDAGAGLLVSAVAVLTWLASSVHCTRCGTATNVTNAGWTRHCPNCGKEHYPRTDSAVIMSIVDADDRILLGRQAVWPEHRFSTLAGFVEPGEPLEAAVRRETLEESGVVVGEVTYRGSQPWPFPASLMVAFRGEALSTDVTVDGVELAEARWWSKQELAADIASGELLLPPPLSIARHLIEDWYGGPLEGPDAWR